MADSVYRALSRVFSVVLPVVGAGAMIGGSFAHRFVSDQLGSEDITMPAPELITQELKTGLISPDDAELWVPANLSGPARAYWLEGFRSHFEP